MCDKTFTLIISQVNSLFDSLNLQSMMFVIELNYIILYSSFVC